MPNLACPDCGRIDCDGCDWGMGAPEPRYRNRNSLSEQELSEEEFRKQREREYAIYRKNYWWK